MPKYITYMSVFFHSRGASPSELAIIMKNLGWKPVYGDYDFAYEWDTDLTRRKESFEFYFEHINNMHDRFENMNVAYTLNTFEQGKKDPKLIGCP